MVHHSVFVSITVKEDRLEWLFSDNGIFGILESTDIKKTDMTSPFIGALFDRIYGEPYICPATSVFR